MAFFEPAPVKIIRASLTLLYTSSIFKNIAFATSLVISTNIWLGKINSHSSSGLIFNSYFYLKWFSLYSLTYFSKDFSLSLLS